jgi:cell division transport system permease protein
MLIQKGLFLQKQAFKTCFINLKAQPILTMITSMMIGFILIWPTFLWVLSIQAKDIIKDWQSHAYFTFYVPNSVKSAQREDVITRLKATDHVQKVKLITPEQSLKKLLTPEEAQSLLQNTTKNPLPYIVEVYPDAQMLQEDQLMDLYNNIANLPFLESSKNDLGWFQRLSAFEKFLNHFSLLLFGILMLGVTFLVSNTLRMVIHSRYDEIQILKLIGASQRFILSPFLYAGAFYGLLGAMVAILSVNIIICLLQDYFKPLAVLYNYVGMIPLMSVMQVFSVMGIAICLGWAAAWVFVRYYLNAIEPV